MYLENKVEIHTQRSHALVNQLLVRSYRVVSDITGSVYLVLCFFLAALLMPFVELFSRLVQVRHIFAVIPLRSYGLILKAMLYREIGRLERSEILWSRVLGEVEKVYMAHTQSALRGQLARTLVDVYVELLDNYLVTGYFEDAALIVIRAHQTLGVDSLPGFSHFDVQTAHLVKTGIAASKMLGGTKAAEIVITPVDEKVQGFGPKSRRDDASHASDGPTPRDTASAKVIPFPAPVT